MGLDRQIYLAAAGTVPKLPVEGAGEAVDGSLGGTVRVPTSLPVILDGPNTRRHVDPDRVVWEHPLVVTNAAHVRAATGQEASEMLHQHQRPEGVDAEGFERLGVVDVLDGLVDAQHAGQGKSQPEVVAGVPGEVLGRARLGGGAHAVLIRHVDVGHVQPGRERTLVSGEAGQQRGLGPVRVGAARRQDGQGGAAEQGAREVVAYAAGGRADQSPGFGHVLV
ncbi:hypothetical protein PspLS_07910 [Pyricularia sp. CBS 133598]|nr:hypothetical protein PspLS_07910 [Pyricularia sp. CBS 133598]